MDTRRIKKVGEYLLYLDDDCEKLISFFLREWWISHFEKISNNPLCYIITIAPHPNPEIDSYDQILFTPGVKDIIPNIALATIPDFKAK